MSAPGEEFGQPAPSLTSPHASFPFADFALCPFAIINYSHEYNYMLSPVSPSSKSVNLGLVWGTPNTHGDSSWNLPHNSSSQILAKNQPCKQTFLKIVVSSLLLAL